MVDLKKLQNTLLIIANEIKRICDKNSIEYTMIGGTLIGAIRHKGFIPWDDDMDFVMTRMNYDKFLNCCRKDLDDKFFVLNWSTNSFYGDGFTKIMLKDTVAIEKGKEYLRLDSLRGNETLEDYYSMLGFVEKGTCIDGNYHGILRERKL